ncbi:hypothetical protein ACPUEN_02570 [Algoriphagus yeomjeoni]|uniref:hypothetical protein n=1 Tax=Algoriphagus yeomjeoni TaxID=291403 RepID=UPI003CE50CAC
MTTTVLIIINIISTCFTAFWLTKRVNDQKLIITEQNNKLDHLKKFSEVLEKYVNAEDVEKLLSTKQRLMEHDLEILRRSTISTTNKSLSEEWGKVIEKNIVPQFEGILTEFSNFIFSYFSKRNFKDKTERNGQIRIFFPEHADMVIDYLDKIHEKTSDQDENL